MRRRVSRRSCRQVPAHDRAAQNGKDCDYEIDRLAVAHGPSLPVRQRFRKGFHQPRIAPQGLLERLSLKVEPVSLVARTHTDRRSSRPRRGDLQRPCDSSERNRASDAATTDDHHKVAVAARSKHESTIPPASAVRGQAVPWTRSRRHSRPTSLRAPAPPHSTHRHPTRSSTSAQCHYRVSHSCPRNTRPQLRRGRDRACSLTPTTQRPASQPEPPRPPAEAPQRRPQAAPTATIHPTHPQATRPRRRILQPPPQPRSALASSPSRQSYTPRKGSTSLAPLVTARPGLRRVPPASRCPLQLDERASIGP